MYPQENKENGPTERLDGYLPRVTQRQRPDHQTQFEGMLLARE